MLARIDAFLTLRRAVFVAAVILAANLVITAVYLTGVRQGIDGYGQPLGGDFIIFYAASDLTLHGRAVQAFDPRILLGVERHFIPAIKAGLQWAYPPTFQLATAPLALAPFAVAYGLFMAVTGVAYLLAIQSIVPGRLALLMTAAFPGFFLNFTCGQNGFMTASILTFGLTLMDRRPWLAGLVLGLMVVKPQLALLLPVLLIGTGRWKTIVGAAASGALVVGLATLVLGLDPWMAFLRNGPIVSRNLATHNLPWAQIPSVFVAVRWLGLGIAGAYVVQGICAVVVAAATLWAWRRPGSFDLKLALALFATFLVSPYAFNYDLVLLGAPIALVVRHGLTHVQPSGTRLILLLAACTPNVFLGLTNLTHLQVMPLAIAGCYAWLLFMLTSARAVDVRATSSAAAASLSMASRSNSAAPGARTSA